MTEVIIAIGLISNICALLGLAIKVAATVHNIRRDLEILRKDLEISRREYTHLNEMGMSVDHQFKEALDHSRTSLKRDMDSDKLEFRALLKELQISITENHRDISSVERFLDKSFPEYSSRAR